MSRISYVSFSEVEAAAFLPLLNAGSTREHLVEHEVFEVGSVRAWMEGKIAVDGEEGSRVRAVLVDGDLAGWCAIQGSEAGPELAVVLQDGFWGVGPRVFRELMGWARELGHAVVVIHLLETRPEYRFLVKRARRVYASEMLGRRFTTYELEVAAFAA